MRGESISPEYLVLGAWSVLGPWSVGPGTKNEGPRTPPSGGSRRRRVDALPQVVRAQLIAAARLQVAEQLRAIGRVPTEHEIDDELAFADFAAVEPGHL